MSLTKNLPTQAKKISEAINKKFKEKNVKEGVDLSSIAKKLSKRKLEAENEDLQERVEAGHPSQDTKQVVFEPAKKLDPNYGRHPLGTSGQNNIYNKKKTYRNE